jgi:pimeloyl-ACP methyl ester carboxylesterase
MTGTVRLLAGEPVKTIDSRDGTTIAYQQTGNGPALVLVYGALNTRAVGSTAELAGLLTPRFTVYTYDRRGRGDSGDAPAYAPQREIEDLAAVIGIAGGSAFVYGHSSGGCLALEAARQLGAATVTKVAVYVAVYEAPYNDDPAFQETWSRYLAQLADALAAGRGGDAVAAFIFMRLTGMPAEQVEGIRHSPSWPALEALAPTLAYDHAGIIGPNSAVPKDRVSAITAPALIMCGGSSLPFMHPTAATLSQCIPRAELRTLDHQDHAVQPVAVAPVQTDFLQH